ncbi:MAG TPA: transposase [Mollicutes bacterium]|nr:transposase [Mollicutes bacterium]
MKKAIKTYNNFLPYIENSFKYDINNGIIEGTNTLIKCIKRISFGYRDFKHFKTRILLIKGHIIYTN